MLSQLDSSEKQRNVITTENKGLSAKESGLIIFYARQVCYKLIQEYEIKEILKC